MIVLQDVMLRTYFTIKKLERYFLQARRPTWHQKMASKYWMTKAEMKANVNRNSDEPSASNVGALLCGTETRVTWVLDELLVLTVMLLTPSLLLRSHDVDIGRLATGWSAAAATDDAGLLIGSGRSDEARRSDDTGFSIGVEEDGGFVSSGEESVLTESWTGSDGGFGVGRGGFGVGRGGVVIGSVFWVVAVPSYKSHDKLTPVLT